jgi:hypothetical protein
LCLEYRRGKRYPFTLDLGKGFFHDSLKTLFSWGWGGGN